MFKTFLLLAIAAGTGLGAEIRQTPFKPDPTAASLETHTILKKDGQHEGPVYRGEGIKNEGRARIEPVRPKGQVIVNHDRMLSDQPNQTAEVNRIDNLAIPNYGFVASPAEVTYPDIAYAPGYGYDSPYGPNGYEVYNEANNYLMEPDTSTLGLLWSQVPGSRTIATYVGHTISWLFGSAFLLFLGSLLTIGVCSYTNMCTLTFNGMQPIHEEMRALVSPERLEKISHAADFVKSAIDKYQRIQKVADSVSPIERRAVFKNNQ